MPESGSHMRLVANIVEWVTSSAVGGDPGRVLVDAPDRLASSKPPRIGGYVPDVYAPLPTGGFAIGEAKTQTDIENRHTHEQFAAFLGWCARHPGSIFVVAVRWHLTRLAARVITRVIEKEELPDVRFVVLDQLAG